MRSWVLRKKSGCGVERGEESLDHNQTLTAPLSYTFTTHPFPKHTERKKRGVANLLEEELETLSFELLRFLVLKERRIDRKGIVAGGCASFYDFDLLRVPLVVLL